jgi:hypothetical protein
VRKLTLLEIGVDPRPCAGTIDRSCAPTVAYAPARALRLPITPSIGERISV